MDDNLWGLLIGGCAMLLVAPFAMRGFRKRTTQQKGNDNGARL